MAHRDREEDPSGAPGPRCSSCGAPTRSPIQRYCLSCGTRRIPLPAAIAKRIEALRRLEAADAASEKAADAASEKTPPAGAGGDGGRERAKGNSYMPTPRAAATAILGVLAFGVILGTVIEPIAKSAGLAPILLDVGRPTAPAEPAAAPAASSRPPAEPAAPAPIATASASTPAAPVPTEPPLVPTSPPKSTPPPEIPETEVLPPVTHVFLIVLGDHGFEEGFGDASPAPYLARTLRERGELLSNYYAVAQGDLANEIGLISGQGPTPATAENCPQYADISPGTVGSEEQAEGEGCVYPVGTQTLAGQLSAAGKSWKAYVEGIATADGGAATCRHPPLGGPDDANSPLPGDPYLTWRNPFVYFHSLLDSGECAERDVGLEQLATDLQQEDQTPALSYIVPDACHDGGDQPCEAGQPAGLAAAQPFLETVVPEIEASDAYKKGGLIAITFGQAPQTGPAADPSSCCGTPEYPNLAPTTAPPSSGPIKSSGGGGRVGMLLLSPFVEPGSVDESGYFNHFSLLLSVEELFELQPLGYAANPALSSFGTGVFNLTS